MEGSKISWERKNVSYEGIFRQNFLRKFWLEFSKPRKFWDHLKIELNSVPFPVLDDASAVLTHASSHTNVAPRALTNVRGRTAVLAGMMIDFFCFQSGLVTLGMIDNSGTRHSRSCLIIAARERPRAGSKQMAMHQAVAQTQSRWSSSCERTSPRCGRKHMATYQAVAQTQSSCL